MMTQNDASVLGATQFAVGLSAIIKMQPTAYQYFQKIKILSGGGTLEIVTPPAALTGVSASGWGAGYPVGASEVISTDGPAVFYLAASGATMSVAMMIGRTTGSTVI